MPCTWLLSAMLYRFSAHWLSGWKKSVRVSLRPAASVPSGPPGLDDVDEDDDVVELLLAADDVVVRVALSELVVGAALEESSAKLLHAAVPITSAADNSAVPTIRRVRPMTPRFLPEQPHRPRTAGYAAHRGFGDVLRPCRDDPGSDPGGRPAQRG